jgi:ADP-heptose:LPS heptosyltransferase
MESGKTLLIKALGGIASRPVAPPGAVDRASIRSILVVRQHDQLGDFLLSLPAVRALRRTFTEARIGLVVREYFGDIALLVPDVDEVIVFRERLSRWTWKSARAFIGALRRDWDLAVVLNTVSHSLTSDLLAHASGARTVLGTEERVFRGARRNFLYNLLAPQSPPLTHQAEKNLAIVRTIGAESVDGAPSLRFSQAELESAALELEKLGLDRARPAIGVHLGAGKAANRWPVERFAELAGSLAGGQGIQTIVFWGPQEEDLHARFASAVTGPVVGAGHPPLRKLAAYSRLCRAFVSGDTGIMHLASAAGVPVVALFGPTDPAQWKPPGAGVIVLRAASCRTEDITAAEVLGALRSAAPMF